MNRNILFITEGSVDEPKLIKKICETYGEFRDRKFFYYCTSLYELMDAVYVNGRHPCDCDLFGLLRESKTGKNKEVLDKNYTDVYLIFDLDPHYQKYKKHSEHLKEMLEWFSESTENGKLFINYPMMQSHQHVPNLWDDSYREVCVDLNEVSDYKSTVKKECDRILFNVKDYDKDTIDRLLRINLMKSNMLVNGVWGLPDDCVSDMTDTVNIHESECELMANRQKISVLNTSLFMILHHGNNKLQ